MSCHFQSNMKDTKAMLLQEYIQYEGRSKSNANYIISQQLLVFLLISFGLPFEVLYAYLNTPFQAVDPLFEAVLVLLNR